MVGEKYGVLPCQAMRSTAWAAYPPISPPYLIRPEHIAMEVRATWYTGEWLCAAATTKGAQTRLRSPMSKSQTAKAIKSRQPHGYLASLLSATIRRPHSFYRRYDRRYMQHGKEPPLIASLDRR